MNFGEALSFLKKGRRAFRDGWNGKGMWIGLQTVLDGSPITLPYIYVRTAGGDLVPWVASQTDMLAEDWDLIP